MEQWRQARGHPCAPFTVHWESENKMKEDAYGRALDKLLKSESHISFKEESEYTFNGPISSKEEKLPMVHEIPHNQSTPKLVNSKSKISYAKYFIGVSILLFLWFYLTSFGWAGIFSQGVLNCTDGTSVQNCSAQKPFFCDENGNLTENPRICGCPQGKRVYKDVCIPLIKCNDGTLDPECSKNKPYQCITGSLVKKASICGCSDGYIQKNNDCQLIKKCSDGTIDGECSSLKPFFCSDSILIDRASLCGCPYSSHIKPIGDKCIDLSKPDASLIESEVHALVNLERQKYGLTSLVWDDKLSEIARQHSQDMVQQDFFAHENLIGQGPTQRGLLMGYYCRKNYGSYYTEGIAENIHQGWTFGSMTYINGIKTMIDWYYPDEIADNAVSGWMHSPGHKQNILTVTYDREGIGVAVSSDGKVLITQDFC
jgi:uncharacterized protein YkwD